MRELEFRFFRQYPSPKMIYPEYDFLINHLGTPCVISRYPNNRIEVNISDIIPLQFVGLKDRNSQKVYEGDICKFYPCDDDSLMFHGLAYMNNNVVGGEWKIIRCDNIDPEIPEIKGEDCLDSSSFWNDDFEIIGNIYENTELLNG